MSQMPKCSFTQGASRLAQNCAVVVLIYCSLSQPTKLQRFTPLRVGENWLVGFRFPRVAVVAERLPPRLALTPGDVQKVAHCRVKSLAQLLWKPDRPPVSQKERNVPGSDRVAKLRAGR